MIPYFSGALRVGKAVLVFLDARFRRNDGRGWVSVRDSSHDVTLGLGPRVQGNESLFCRGVKSRKSGIVYPGSSHAQG